MTVAPLERDVRKVSALIGAEWWPLRPPVERPGVAGEGVRAGHLWPCGSAGGRNVGPTSTGRVVGVEMAPQAVSLERPNQLLADLGEAPLAEQDGLELPEEVAAPLDRGVRARSSGLTAARYS
ncbi:MAG: hypothetical protein ABR606_20225 [Vicinamibacterales bacterium]